MYLHGAPKAFAPKVQTHVASVVWFGPQFDYTLSDLRPYEKDELTHDALFCTLLLAYELDTSTCMQSRKVIEKSHNDAMVSSREKLKP